MTKLISVLIILVVVFCGYHIFRYWQQVEAERSGKKQAEAGTAVNPAALTGMPAQLEASLHAAKQEGNAAFRAWLKNYDAVLQDPRRAWIELEFCVAIVRENPAEARRIFAEVKSRTPPSSPVWPWMKSLERSFD